MCYFQSQRRSPHPYSPRQPSDAHVLPGTAMDIDPPKQMNETGCSYAMRSDTDDERYSAHRSLPSLRRVMQVLYPPYLGVPSPSPEPPSYSQSDSPSHPGDDPENFPLISSTANTEETSLSYGHLDPLAWDPSLTGVPSQGIPTGRIPPAESNPPSIDLGGVIPDEPLPAYSRFDQRRLRSPAASDVLGPYPPLSVLSQSVQ